MSGSRGKWLVSILLAFCLGVQIVEASGRWDRTLSDANDEAAIVVIVLCVGVGLAAAAALTARMRPARTEQRWIGDLSRVPRSRPRRSPTGVIGGPPTTLRI